MADYIKHGFVFRGFDDLVPGTVFQFLIAGERYDAVTVAVRPVTGNPHARNIDVVDRNGSPRLVQVHFPESYGYSGNNNTITSSTTIPCQIFHNCEGKFAGFADYRKIKELEDGVYENQDGEVKVKIGNTIYSGKKGIVTQEQYFPPDNTRDYVNPCYGFKRSVHGLSHLPGEVLAGGVFVVSSTTDNSMSLHRRREHGIEPLPGFNRLRVSDLKTGYRIKPFTQNKDCMTIKDGDTLVATRLVSSDKEMHVLRIKEGEILVSLVPSEHKEGQIIRASSFAFLPQSPSKEFIFDRAMGPGSAYIRNTGEAKHAEVKNPAQKYLDMMSIGYTTIRHGLPHTSLGFTTEENQNDTVTRILEYGFYGPTRNISPQDFTFALFCGNIYSESSSTLTIDHASYPDQLPNLRDGDLIETYEGYKSVYFENHIYGLLTKDYTIEPDIYARPMSAGNTIERNHQGVYQYVQSGPASYRMALPHKLLASAGSWCLEGLNIRVLDAPDDVATWLNDGIPLPIHRSSLHSSGIPTILYDLRNYSCPGCNQMVSRDSCTSVQGYSRLDRVTLCSSCVDNPAIVERCTSCRRQYLASSLNENGECPECFRINNAQVIRNHSYRPKPIFHGVGNLFYGTEIELENMTSTPRETIAIEAMKGREKFIYAKNDGSLQCGIEFVSHPFSAAWLQENADAFKGFYDVVGTKYKMQSSARCGIHIHTSKLGYAVDPKSVPGCEGKEIPSDRLISRGLMRVQKFVYGHPNLMKHFAGRSSSNYASLSSGPGSNSRVEEMIDLSKNLTHGKDCRYTGLNVTEKTLEFRIFRSTTDLKELLRDIMFVDSIVQFIRQAAVPKTGAPSLHKYRAYLLSDPKYSDVLTYYDAWAASSLDTEMGVNFVTDETERKREIALTRMARTQNALQSARVTLATPW
jgi:hypothetical protein